LLKIQVKEKGPCESQSSMTRSVASRAVFEVREFSFTSSLCPNCSLRCPDAFDLPCCPQDMDEEKVSRSRIKEAVEREVTGSAQDVLLVVSVSTYIKGFRYELFCRARSQSTNTFLVFCESDVEDDSRANGMMDNPVWEDELLRDLHQRMEVPATRNKWERTIFVLKPDDPPLYTKVADSEPSADTTGKEEAEPAGVVSATGLEILSTVRGSPTMAKQNAATASQVPAATNFLHELDSRTNDIVSAIIREMQVSGTSKNILPGRLPHMPAAAPALVLPARTVTPAELRRRRRTFVHARRQNVVAIEQIGPTFIEHLNEQLS
jgi:protein KTI12